jgi:hypothetical protein
MSWAAKIVNLRRQWRCRYKNENSAHPIGSSRTTLACVCEAYSSGLRPEGDCRARVREAIPLHRGARREWLPLCTSLTIRCMQHSIEPLPDQSGRKTGCRAENLGLKMTRCRPGTCSATGYSACTTVGMPGSGFRAAASAPPFTNNQADRTPYRYRLYHRTVWSGAATPVNSTLAALETTPLIEN